MQRSAMTTTIPSNPSGPIPGAMSGRRLSAAAAMAGPVRTIRCVRSTAMKKTSQRPRRSCRFPPTNVPSRSRGNEALSKERNRAGSHALPRPPAEAERPVRGPASATFGGAPVNADTWTGRRSQSGGILYPNQPRCGGVSMFPGQRLRESVLETITTTGRSSADQSGARPGAHSGAHSRLDGIERQS
jgi:hypothetical protein